MTLEFRRYFAAYREVDTTNIRIDYMFPIHLTLKEGQISRSR